ncbi:hypothetical protein XENORESO_016841 [Xenotaenia resolanae]|uniref:Uncharacterized protein n=1 Tax=Xenotaenia resolanae TaxID=208358 RepID=A0ABV0W5I2_9TELE
MISLMTRLYDQCRRGSISCRTTELSGQFNKWILDRVKDQLLNSLCLYKRLHGHKSNFCYLFSSQRFSGGNAFLHLSHKVEPFTAAPNGHPLCPDLFKALFKCLFFCDTFVIYIMSLVIFPK